MLTKSKKLTFSILFPLLKQPTQEQGLIKYRKIVQKTKFNIYRIIKLLYYKLKPN